MEKYIPTMNFHKRILKIIVQIKNLNIKVCNIDKKVWLTYLSRPNRQVKLDFINKNPNN